MIVTANHIVQIIGKSLHQFHVWRQLVTANREPIIVTANHIVQIIGKSLHQFHVWRQLVEFFLILSIADDFRRIKQLFQMTQHAARKMAFSRLCLPADVKVRRRFKSHIYNVICKLNSIRYVLCYLL